MVCRGISATSPWVGVVFVDESGVLRRCFMVTQFDVGQVDPFLLRSLGSNGDLAMNTRSR